MFRDLKEYQEIAKIYAEKVSKPENLEERSRSNPSGLTPEQKKANQKGFVNRILFGNIKNYSIQEYQDLTRIEFYYLLPLVLK